MKYVLLTLISFILVGVTFGADDKQELKLISQAKKGDAIAQTELGKKYLFGRGVEQDIDKSNKWFREAAKQDSAEAQYYLGVIDDMGLVSTKNFKKAVKWYRKSAKLGFADAQFTLGRIYEVGGGEKSKVKSLYDGNVLEGPDLFVDPEEFVQEEARQETDSRDRTRPFSDQRNFNSNYEQGYTIKVDYAESFNWYEKAALQGHPQSQIKLGVLYAKGQGTEKNIVSALSWLTIATHEEDSDKLAQLVDKFKAGMTAEQIDEADRSAQSWLADYKNKN